MTPEQELQREAAKRERRLAIAHTIIDAALEMCWGVKQLETKKMIFGKKNRTPKNRLKRKDSIRNLLQIPLETRAKIQRITSMPLPYYPKGHDGGISKASASEINSPL